MSLTVGVVIPAHNYGRFLAAAIDSCLFQSRRPDEILVVDDASTDDTKAVAERYADHGVRYEKVKFRHSQKTRRHGLECTKSDVLCFLDADDVLGDSYLRHGMRPFRDPSIGIVYSDLAYFGNATGQTEFPATMTREDLARENKIHSGSLVRVQALTGCGGLDEAVDEKQSAPDWRLWRRVLAAGWKAVKQPGLYRYRRHGKSMSSGWNEIGVDYWQHASLDKETVTLVVPLAGRRKYLPRMLKFLAAQKWPHNQTRLVILDSSQDADFGRDVREWMAKSDYPDARYIAEAVGHPKLADKPREFVSDEVNASMGRIYTRLLREASTDYVWIVEDDILPPLDACEQLLRGFTHEVTSVSGAYPSRHVEGWLAWDKDGELIEERGEGVQDVAGTGFGCVVVRGGVARDHVYSTVAHAGGIDCAYYAANPGARINWDVVCKHGGK